ncbi:MAG: serine hydrolase domain-containing protein, partial [Aureliella sp.]
MMLGCVLRFNASVLWSGMGLVVLLTSPCLAQSQTSPSTPHAAALEKLQSAIQYEVAAKDLPAFSIAVVDGDRVVYADGFGYVDPERREPATADTIYRVGSVSKLFTDVAVMQLVESGQLDLDAPVQKVLPSFQPKNSSDTPITLRQLMSHRSGLVREPPVGHYFDPLEPSLADTVKSLNQTALVYPPDTRTKYSNAAIAVVGAALEASTATDYAARIEQTIFQPLGMTSSTFVRTPEVDRRLAPATMWTLEGRRFAAPQFSLGTAPAGNMYSTVKDLAKFIGCMNNAGRHADGRLLKAETIELMTTPQKDAEGKPQSFGIGFHVGQLDGERKIGHGGAVYGCATQLEMLPDQRLGVAAVAALDCANGTVERLANYALSLLLAQRAGKPLPDYPRTEPVAAERAESLVGSYRSGDAIVELSYGNGRLTMKHAALHSQLRALAGSGDLVVDDVLGYGPEVRPQSDGSLSINDQRYERLPDEPPAPAKASWQGLIGEYGWDHDILFILEDRGRLVALIEWFYAYPLTELG